MKFYEFIKGLWKENPIFCILLGLCPTLAVTNAAINGLTMGIAVIFVLFFSALIVSLIKNLIPKQVRIPCYIVIIATFVTITDLVLKAFWPGMSKTLSIYVPLIIVNCIILGRIEAFSSKNSVANSLLDALGMGFGFTFALLLISVVREFLGFGAIFGFTLLGSWYPQMLIMKLPTGAFFTLGLLIALYKIINKRGAANV